MKNGEKWIMWRIVIYIYICIYSSPDIRIIRARMRHAKCVACTQGLVEELEGKRLLGRPRYRWDITQWIANELGGRVLAGFIRLRESDSG
jgi:hypothetical protein